MSTTGGRLRALQIVFAAAFLLVAAQSVRMQVIGADATLGGNGERLRVLPIEPSRGQILDRNGVVMAWNSPRFSLAIVPGDLPEQPEARRRDLLRVEAESGVAYSTIDAALQGPLARIDPLSPVAVRDSVEREEAVRLRAALADIPAVRVVARPIREYGGGDALPHVLGYVGPLTADDAEAYVDRGYALDARVGRAGVEATYEEALRGRPGSRLAVADPSGRVLDVRSEDPAEAGADLVLALDLDLQQAAQAALERGVRSGLATVRAEAGREPPIATGAVVVMDARSGKLRALATTPSFDAQVFSGVPGEELGDLIADPARPLVHRGFQEVRSPGSIFKPLVGAAALEDGIATAGTRITSTGALIVRNRYDPSVVYRFGDWAAHGTLDFAGGIARSSDVYFYYLAGGYDEDDGPPFEGLGAERLAWWAETFGLGRPTGVDLPGEASGLVPTPGWKREQTGDEWLLGDTYTFGIGQGYLTTTPLEMAVATAAIANGGTLWTPQVAEALRQGEQVTPVAPIVAGRVPVSAEHLATVRAAMRAAADPEGTAITGEPPGITIGGKTGTAEWGRPYADGEFDTHGWYAGFAPYDDPEIVVIVYLQHGVGSTHAGPVAREVLAAYFEQEVQRTRSPAGTRAPVGNAAGAGAAADDTAAAEATP